ncbi:hypothetical protein GCM10007052_30980 [Halioglobus japonicus]|uniref:hypothetical protein n=1 Tax=Halioglobus japonicus TaxID=930805 RepID=UPI0012F4BEA8|nr:hypothetical protein [Halioglobus japonicus]GHD20885.1 hypothetical protein GCM10007052_30980 [Halioglobus japonicus]
MIWLLLFTLVAIGVFIDSIRLFSLGLLFMSIKAFPRYMLMLIGTVIAWSINYLKR